MITTKQSSEVILNLTKNIEVIPVIVIDDVSRATDLAKILVDAGLPIIEVTLRTPNAIRVIEAMANVDGAIVAAGTVLNKPQVIDVKSAGAEFIVSPGYTPELSTAAMEADMPFLPGVATASEVMLLVELGFSFLKFFPASINGGIPALKALASPFPQVSFCPTGGISASDMHDYLALNNVECVGGSWLVTQQDVLERNWPSISNKVSNLKYIDD